MRSEGYVVVVSVWPVCLSLTYRLTLEASLRPENAVMYLAGDEGQNICAVFSETVLERSLP